MKFIQAGEIDLIELEPDQGMIQNLASQAGFDCNIEESERSLTLEAKPQKTKELKKPINVLEKVEDTKLTWRRKVNNELKTNYKKIYNLIDKKIYLKVPNFKYVLKWRLLQEKKLGLKSKNKIMNNKQITRFIMFYERVTKNMLNNFQDNDFVIILDKKHKIKSIKF